MTATNAARPPEGGSAPLGGSAAHAVASVGAPLLKVTDLKKAYGAIQAVGGVSFEVQPG